MRMYQLYKNPLKIVDKDPDYEEYKIFLKSLNSIERHHIPIEEYMNIEGNKIDKD
jgi:hypothetical protein